MSIIAIAVKHLMTAGVTGDALVTAIEEMEEAQNPAKSNGAIRQHRYRERNKASQIVTDVTNVTPPSSSPLPLLSPTPPYNSNPPSPTPGSAAVRATGFFEKCFELATTHFPNLTPSNIAPIHAWQQAGYDFDLHIKPVLDSCKAKGATPRGFNFFTAAIEDSAKLKVKPVPLKEKPIEITPERAKELEDWYRKMGKQHQIFNPDGVRA